MSITSSVKNCDESIKRAIHKLSKKLGNLISSTALTASRIVATDSNKKLVSVSDFTNWISGTADEITVSDDGDGTITLALSTPLGIAKGGTGVTSLTDHSLLVGSDTDAITTLGVATNGQLPIGSTGADPVLANLTGTTNQITITNGAGSITLSTPQDIATSSNPQFVLITLTGTPTVATDSVNKAYADSLVGGAFWNNVAVATIANVDLSADLEAGDTIDDYTLVAGDRVLVKEQTDATENGLYVVPASGAASRATDADEEVEILNKKCIPTNGALTANHLYFCVNSSITIGVTDIEFAELTTVADHNSLSALQGGQSGPPTEYYHLTSARHTTLGAIGDLAVTDGNFIVGNGSTWVAESGATVRTSLGLTIGSDVQAYDAGLDSLSGLTYVSDSFIKVTAEDTYAIRTIAETKTDLSLNNVENTAISTWAGSANIVTVGTLTSGAIGAGFTSISTSYTDAKCTDATADNTAANETSHSDVVVDGDFASAGVCKTDGAGTYSIGTLGIADNNIVEIDDLDAADNDYCKLTANGIEGRSYSEVLSDLSGTAGGAFAWNSQNLTGVAALVINDAGTIGSTTDTDIMTLAADGTCTFSVFPVTPSAAPDADYEVANKKYVDDNAGGGGASEITFEAKDRIGPSSNFATLDTLTGGSTPAEIIDVLDFDASSSEYADFKSTLFAGYANGGLTLVIAYSMTSDADEATPHKVRWEAALRRVNDDAEVITASHTYQFNGVSDIVPSELGELSYATITFTDGVDMDSLDAGEKFILRIYRDHDHADDNATGDAEFWSVTITET